MVVHVEGECKKQQQLVYNVVEHCYLKLIPQFDVDIFVNLKSKIENNLNGWCQHNYSNNYDIVIDADLPTLELIKTVCHEMVHVKQGAKNELVESYGNKYQRTWKGIEYENELPWELEAYKLEDELFKTFMELHVEGK